MQVLRYPNIASCLILALFGLVFCWPAGLQAAEKVETNLEKAIKSGKKQILFSGKEKDDITIKSGVAVTGTGSASIMGDIKMENGSSLANVTVIGKTIAITVAKGASVTLSNVTVQGGSDTGIFAPQGGGTLTVKNSRIIKNRKGFYILPGKNLNLSGNTVSENKEEGLDVRAGTSGSITGNQFVNNGEGGAEIIAGSARLTIKGNTFAGNKSSGLAIQSYAGSGKAPGSVALNNNTFANNRDFGLSCISPSKGGAGAAFYKATIKAIDNTFRANGAGNISAECGGVVNRSSAVIENQAEDNEAAASEESAINRDKLRAEAVGYFDDTISLLHEREYLLEQTLVAYAEAMPWNKRLFAPAVEGVAKDQIIEDIARINELRTVIATFPEEWLTPELAVRQAAVVSRSLERMEELRQYFERLQKPLFQLR